MKGGRLGWAQRCGRLAGGGHASAAWWHDIEIGSCRAKGVVAELRNIVALLQLALNVT